MTLNLCFGAHKSWLIVLKSPLRFATWHHKECLSSKIVLFNGGTVLESGALACVMMLNYLPVMPHQGD